MKTSVRFLGGLAAAAFVLGSVAASTAIAQEKGKSTTKVLAENDKVRVWETRFRPGDENRAPPNSATRVLRVLKGGTLLWTYADGKSEKVEYKTGEVKILGPGPQFTARNIGKTDVVLYVVMLK